MIYPDNIEIKLGFDKVRDKIKGHCLSLHGESLVDKISFQVSYKSIKTLVEQTNEFKSILQLNSEFPSQNYQDMREALDKLRIEDLYLNAEEFYNLKLSLETIQGILDFFAPEKEQPFSELRKLVDKARPTLTNSWRPLINSLEKVFDERGLIKDNASPELQSIRRKIEVEQRQVRNELHKLFKTVQKEGWISDDMSITVRNGRLVIPVLSEHKRKLKGFVHDESSSGQMAFVEPSEVIEKNNFIRELEIQERREIVKILKDLSKQISPQRLELEQAYTILGEIDFIRAKAKFALEIDANNPIFRDERVVEWRNAKHPLLLLAHKNLGKEIVPLDVEINENQKILLVSGPNAGGKSVMLKTIGLLQYMFQCGLLVSVSPDSKFGLFRNLFLDIGDEQSIENDLSTYSSHLKNMRFFSEKADDGTLVLIDEFGTGTDPSLGGAIAESILEEILDKKAYGVINTHYSNLKTFASEKEEILNCAMKFDADQLEPMYQLEMGKPGSSFALEVASKMGLSNKIISKAKSKLNSQQVDFEKLNKELEIEKKVFTEKNIEFRERNHQLNQKLEQYTLLKDFLEAEKARIINEAKAEAKSILDQSNKKIESTIREIKESNAEAEKTKKLREQLQDFKNKELKSQKVESQKTEEIKTEKGEIRVGDLVRIKGQETMGEVLDISNKDVQIAIGQLKSNVKLNRLEKISKKEYKKAKNSNSFSGIDYSSRAENFTFNLDIRGKRGDEALNLLDRTIDDAIILGMPELRIVHGKGDGILRNLVRTHLKKYKQIKSLKDEHADRGGHGVTLVEMQ